MPYFKEPTPLGLPSLARANGSGECGRSASHYTLAEPSTRSAAEVSVLDKRSTPFFWNPWPFAASPKPPWR